MDNEKNRLKKELKDLYSEVEQLRLDSHFIGIAFVRRAIEVREKRIAEIEEMGIRLD